MRKLPLAEVIGAVEAEGEALRPEFHRPEGPRGRRGSAPIDREIEERLCTKLRALVGGKFCGEETDAVPRNSGFHWVVDPHDGTSEFLSGRRGSARSVPPPRRT